MQVLPLAFDVRKRVWMETTASMALHQTGAHEEPVEWRDRMLTFDTSCYGCHVSQLATNFDACQTADLLGDLRPARGTT